LKYSFFLQQRRVELMGAFEDYLAMPDTVQATSHLRFTIDDALQPLPELPACVRRVLERTRGQQLTTTVVDRTTNAGDHEQRVAALLGSADQPLIVRLMKKYDISA
jgi:hypothetical protein